MLLERMQAGKAQEEQEESKEESKEPLTPDTSAAATTLASTVVTTSSERRKKERQPGVFEFECIKCRHPMVLHKPTCLNELCRAPNVYYDPKLEPKQAQTGASSVVPSAVRPAVPLKQLIDGNNN